MNELDIAKFAEGLLNEQEATKQPVHFAPAQASTAPDVSEVVVSDEFTSSVLTEGLWDKANISVNKAKVASPARHSFVEDTTPTPTNEETISTPINEESVYKKHLVEEYKKKVSDLEELISLMENMGMVGGVNTVGRGAGQPNFGGASKKLQTKLRRKKKKSGRTNRFNK